MTQVIGSGGIRHHGIHVEDAAFPFNMENAVVLADVGKAMTIDTGADCSAKLAGDGDRVIGKLQTFEDRVQEGVKVGTVLMQGGFQFNTTGVVAVGNSVVGSATAGSVKAASATRADNMVTAVDAGNNTCQVIFF